MNGHSLEKLKEAAVIYALRQCPLLAGLSPEELSKIAEITVPRTLEDGQYLFREGESVQGFYVVQKGAVNIHRVSPSGKEKIIHVFRPGESFAEAALAAPGGYPADARAVGPTQVLLVRRAGFMELLKTQPELILRMLASISSHLKDLVEQIEDMALKDVETRVATWLLKHCPRPESAEAAAIELKEQKRILAAELGTSSETFSRTLAKFRDEGLIEVRGQLITVVSPSKLSAYLRAHAPE